MMESVVSLRGLRLSTMESHHKLYVVDGQEIVGGGVNHL
jgi:hypothetical protein